MAFDPRFHHRRSVRLRAYDYGTPGAYFVTICVNRRQRLFGEITGGSVRLNAYGRIVAEEWYRTAVVRPTIRLDAFVVMPDHIHGIVIIERPPANPEPIGSIRGESIRCRGMARHAPTGSFAKPQSGSLATIIGAFKAAVTKRINRAHGAPGGTIWQRGYHEHVIRNGRALENIRRYIARNPYRGQTDPHRPGTKGKSP